MRIARINNINFNANEKKNQYTKDLIQRVNQRMIETGGKPTELSPLDKFADLMLDENIKTIPVKFKETQKKFDSLSKFEQDKLLIFEKKKKNIRELAADKEKLNSAFKKAMDSVLKKS